MSQASGCLGKEGHGRQREQNKQWAGKKEIGVLRHEELPEVAGEEGEERTVEMGVMWNERQIMKGLVGHS